ncbi:phage tail tape measure protein [Escherichia coli]
MAVEQSRLTQMQGKAQSIQDVLAGLEERRVALIRQQAAEQKQSVSVPVDHEWAAYRV